jgi:hypothetical protein
MRLRSLTTGLAFSALVLAVLSLPPHAAAAPAIVITNLPAYGSTNDLGGYVTGVAPGDYRVAVFTCSAAAGWNTKPFCASPLTAIQSDGSWTTDITTAGTDTNATRIAALLVSSNYSEACVQGAAYLSTNIFAQSVASAVTTRPSPGLRWLTFSGCDWWVKNYTSPVGPGPNYFSDSTNNVWVDALGQLHLRITHRSNQWQCAEVVTTKTLGYGSYRFTLNSAVDGINPQVVLGLFTYSDDPAYNHREIDIECSRWSNPADSNNSQFVVQPAGSRQIARFPVPAGATNSTLSMLWESNKVSYTAQRGPYSTDPANTITNWTCTSGIPLTGDECARLNLWLDDGLAPTNNAEVEVIIQSFQFVPLSTFQSNLLSLPLYDEIPADYTEGGNLGAPGAGDDTWNLPSTPGGVTNILVTTNAALSYPGLRTPPDGSRGVAVAYTNALFSAGISFPPVSSGSLYTSFLLKLTTLPTSGNTRCLAGLSAGTTYANTPELTIGLTSAGKLLVARQTVGSPVSTLTPALTLGQTYLVVARYNFVSGATNDTVDLWLNPSALSFGADEGNVPAATVAGYSDSSKADPASLLAFFIPAQKSTAMVERWCMDEFRIGTAWRDVTPPSGAAGKLEVPVSLGGASFRLRYLGAAGAKYALDWASNLVAPVAWSPQITNTSAFDGLVSYTNTHPVSPNFWRTRAVP